MFQFAIQPTNDFIVRIVFTTNSPYNKKMFLQLTEWKWCGM